MKRLELGNTEFAKRLLRVAFVYAVLVWVNGFAVEDIPDADVSAVKSVKTNVEKKSSAFKYRLYTYGNFDYLELDTNSTSPAVRTGLIASRTASLSLNGEFTWKPAPFFTLKMDAQAAFSTDFPSNTAFFKKGAKDFVALNEFFVELYPVDFFSFLVGKYRRVFSPGLFANPMDRHNANPSLPGAPVQREGAWLAQASLHLAPTTKFFRDVAFDVAFLPSLYRDDFGLPTTTNTVRRILPTFTYSETNTNWSPERLGGFLHGYANLFEGDFHLTAYYLETQWQFGFSYARYLGKWLEVHGEGLYYNENHRDGLGNGGFFDALVGVRVEPTQDIGLVMEYQHLGDHPEDFPSAASERVTFLSGLLFPTDPKSSLITPLRDYLTVSVYARNLLNDHFDITCNTVLALKYPEALVNLRLDARVGDNARLSLTGAMALGPGDGFYKFVNPYNFRVGGEIYVGI
ncbi:MAG: hypothetical protein JNM63_09275 [Spirochaetia bacterium]|nr:hypothetical protein [Spirochaetia bacterium]